MISVATAAEATTLRVTVKIDDQPDLVSKIQTTHPQQMKADQWFAESAINALTDDASGVKLFTFTTGTAGDYDLALRVHHKRGVPPWPVGQVSLEMRVLNLVGAETEMLALPILGSLVDEPERPSYVDDWFTKKIVAIIENGALHRNLLQHIPILTRALVKNGNQITTTLAPLARRSILLAVRWSENKSLWFVQCDPQTLGGPIFLTAPDGPGACTGGSNWARTPKTWDRIYVERAWSER